MSERPWLALQVTLFAQTLASFVMAIAPVLAPAVAPQLGIATERVGLFNGTAYLCAMFSGVALGGWIDRLGPVRFTQFVLGTTTAAALLSLVGTPVTFVLAAVLIGVGYGAINPAAAAILGRHAPRNAPGLFFALKQSGVPAGVALAGVLMPVSLLAFGWRVSVLLAAVACLVFVIAIVPTRRLLEPPASELHVVPRTGWIAALGVVWKQPALRQLSLMSTAYAAAQLGFLTFTVSLLVKLGLGLPVAAGLLAAGQVVAVMMRIGMGHVADRWVSPRRLLGMQGLAMAAGCVGLALLPTEPPVWLAGLAVVAAGGTLMGWNGVFYAQLVRVVPRETLAQSSGATQFFMFGGSMLGPSLFSQLLHFGASYGAGFVCLGAIAAVAGWTMLRAPPLPR